MSENKLVFSELDRILLAGLGRADAGGNLIFGVKDLFDVLKNLVVVGSLLFSCITSSIEPPSKTLALDPSLIGLIGIGPLALILLVLVRQAFLVIENISKQLAETYPRGRILISFALLFLVLGICCGLITVVFHALGKGGP